MSVKIDQAFVSDFISQNFGLEIAHENEAFGPSTSYAAIKALHNPERRKTFADLNEITGVFQVILWFPEGEGAMPAKIKAQEILDAYPIDRTLEYDGQSVSVTDLWRPDAVPEKGWYKVRLEIGWKALTQR